MINWNLCSCCSSTLSASLFSLFVESSLMGIYASALSRHCGDLILNKLKFNLIIFENRLNGANSSGFQGEFSSQNR